ncbi:S24 family peptidase [Elioraea sp.]|uniref:LexA family transcriptional regulator n=1 Tax=Elioraea sp. TaxID=2185103 RepID=UPI0021DE6F73|nr:S24 family peptidase [Elioraea sp.]GIX10337.1 MAG: transcriptional regulator [Elioraea sp.]
MMAESAMRTQRDFRLGNEVRFSHNACMDIEVIRRALAKPGKTQRGLAAALGVDPAAVNRLLKGERQLKAAEIAPAARYLEIELSADELAITGVRPRPRHPNVVDIGPDAFALVPVYDASASAGPGRIGGDAVVSRIAFRLDWLQSVTRARIEELAVIKVDGDSMEPTLRHGDTVLIDRTQTNVVGREGIYVIRVDDCLQVKRVAANPVERRLTLGSDNAAYPSFRDIRPEDVDVIGRVIWLGRQVAG